MGAVFDEFDRNRDGMITFEEFRTTLQMKEKCKSEPSEPLTKIGSYLEDRPPSARGRDN
jgi:Ca2+-binding EF-hand superfamily protein